MNYFNIQFINYSLEDISGCPLVLASQSVKLLQSALQAIRWHRQRQDVVCEESRLLDMLAGGLFYGEDGKKRSHFFLPEAVELLQISLFYMGGVISF